MSRYSRTVPAEPTGSAASRWTPSLRQMPSTGSGYPMSGSRQTSAAGRQGPTGPTQSASGKPPPPSPRTSLQSIPNTSVSPGPSSVRGSVTVDPGIRRCLNKIRKASATYSTTPVQDRGEPGGSGESANVESSASVRVTSRRIQSPSGRSLSPVGGPRTLAPSVSAQSVVIPPAPLMRMPTTAPPRSAPNISPRSGTGSQYYGSRRTQTEQWLGGRERSRSGGAQPHVPPPPAPPQRAGSPYGLKRSDDDYWGTVDEFRRASAQEREATGYSRGDYRDVQSDANPSSSGSGYRSWRAGQGSASSSSVAPTAQPQSAPPPPPKPSQRRYDDKSSTGRYRSKKQPDPQ